MEFLTNLYEKLIEIPRWQKWLIITLIAVLLLTLLYFSHIRPIKEQLTLKERKFESLSLTVNKLKVVEKRKSKLEKEISKYKNQLNLIESELPTGKEEVSKIIRSISKADDGTTVVSIRRGTPLSKRYYVEVPYSLELKGTYPQFIHWCEKLSKANRILNFGDFSINSISPQKGEDYTIDVNLKITAFNLKR